MALRFSQEVPHFQTRSYEIALAQYPSTSLNPSQRPEMSRNVPQRPSTYEKSCNSLNTKWFPDLLYDCPHLLWRVAS